MLSLWTVVLAMTGSGAMSAIRISQRIRWYNISARSRTTGERSWGKARYEQTNRTRRHTRNIIACGAVLSVVAWLAVASVPAPESPSLVALVILLLPRPRNVAPCQYHWVLVYGPCSPNGPAQHQGPESLLKCAPIPTYHAARTLTTFVRQTQADICFQWARLA